MKRFLATLLILAVLAGCIRSVNYPDLSGKLPLTASASILELESESPEDVRDYIVRVVNNNNSVWQSFFVSKGLLEPVVQTLILQDNDTYTLACVFTDPIGVPVQVTATANTNNAFYCSADGSGEGLLLFPLNTMVRVVKGDVFGRTSDIPGDFAVATVVSHEFGHSIVDELAQQLHIDAPFSIPNDELLVDCFAGAWTSSADASGMLQSGDLEEALALTEAVGNGTHGSSRQRMAAFRLGYSSGEPAACLRDYWPQSGLG